MKTSNSTPRLNPCSLLPDGTVKPYPIAPPGVYRTIAGDYNLQDPLLSSGVQGQVLGREAGCGRARTERRPQAVRGRYGDHHTGESWNDVSEVARVPLFVDGHNEVPKVRITGRN